jgi:hypothetical protein
MATECREQKLLFQDHGGRKREQSMKSYGNWIYCPLLGGLKPSPLGDGFS